MDKHGRADYIWRMAKTRERDADSAELFREKLGQLGVTQTQFARDIYMSPITVNRWAAGFQRPDGIVWAYMDLRIGIESALPEKKCRKKAR